jgi:carboxylesterase type B
MYSFEAPVGFSQGQCYGVAHSYELPFIFPGLTKDLNYTFTSQEANLSNFMRLSWANFATHLNPNGLNTDGPWPAYQPDGEYIILNFDISQGTNLRGKYCSFWN